MSDPSAPAAAQLDPEPEFDDGRARLARRVDLRGRSLRGLAAQGTMVNAAFTVAIDSIGFVKGFIVAGFLTANDYGLWALIFIGMGTLLRLRQIGINDKFVQQEEEDQELAFQKAFTLDFGLNVICFFVLAAVVPLFALLYGQSDMLLPGWVTCFALLAVSFHAPIWVYYRRMQFLRQRALAAVDPLVGFTTTIVLAIAGAGVWALVAGIVVGTFAGAIAAVAFTPYPIRFRYDRGTLNEYWKFSGPLFAASAATLVIPQLSVLLGEAELGLAAVGYITLASSISIYADRVDTLITSALYPAVCAVADRRDVLFESFVKSNRLTLMWGVPFGVGLTLFAPDLVQFGLSEERWGGAVGTIQAFGSIAAINHVAFNWTAYYRALGNTKPMMKMAFLSGSSFLLFVVPGILIWGLSGFVAGMGVVTLIAVAGRIYYVTQLFPGFRLSSHFLRAFLPLVPAVLVVDIARVIETGPRTVVAAIVEVVLFSVVTVTATVLAERALLREAIGYFRGRGGLVAAPT